MSLNGWYHGRFDEHGELSPATIPQTNEMKPPVVADDLADLLEAEVRAANDRLDDADVSQEALAQRHDQVVACYNGILAMRHFLSPRAINQLTILVRHYFGSGAPHAR